jgi:hypothetical protein
MKWKVLLLNYDSEWVEYCNPSTFWFAEEAKADLLRKGFKEFQTKLVKCE